MSGLASRALDREILLFIKKYSKEPAPDAAFEALALGLFRFQFKQNDPYRQFCLASGKNLPQVKHWREIPAIPTAGFKELVLAAFPAKKAIKVFKTSGTTQGRTSASATRASADAPRGAHFFDTLKLYKASIAPPFRQYLLPDIKASSGFQPDTQNFLFCYLIHSPKDAPHSSLSYMIGVIDRLYAKGRGRYFIRGFKIDAPALIEALGRGQKAFILSTAFSLKNFLDVLKEKRVSLRLPRGSRIMETGGFKGHMKEISKKELYQECRKRLGIDPAYCVSEYGMTELSSQFYDTTLRDKWMGVRRKPFKAGPAWIRTLVVDPKTGRIAKKGAAGLLRHIDLANRGSVIAIQTEDLGRETGEGFELLGRAKDSELRGCSLAYEEFLRS